MEPNIKEVANRTRSLREDSDITKIGRAHV